MDRTEKLPIFISSIPMMGVKLLQRTVVRILALISEHAWTMQKMILQVSECISGRKSKARLEPKVIRVIRVRGLNRHLLHTRFQLPEQQFQLAHGLGLCHLHPLDSIYGQEQLSHTPIAPRLLSTVLVEWELTVQMAAMGQMAKVLAPLQTTILLLPRPAE